MCYATPVQHKIGTDKIIQRYTHSTWIFYTFRKWFQTFTPAQPEIFAKISLYTKLVQPDFSYISKIWFQDSTPAQPEIFGDDMVVHYTRTTWLSRHLYNLISGFYTCATWNLYLYGKVTYFTLHSHTLIFITFAKHDFRGFFILVMCFFSYVNIFRIYIVSKLSRSQRRNSQRRKKYFKYFHNTFDITVMFSRIVEEYQSGVE